MLQVACVSVGLREHGHNISFSPFAAQTVLYAVWQQHQNNVGCHLLDMVLLGLEGTIQELEVRNIDVLLLSVPVSGYWYLGVKLCEWAHSRGIPILAGGYHFNIEGSQIPYIAAKQRRIAVCYGDGKITAPTYIKHLLEHKPFNTVPNLYFWDKGEVIKTPASTLALGTFPYPSLPLELHDPRAYWNLLAKTPMHKSGMDVVDGTLIGRTLIGPEVLLGCTYRTSRLRAKKSACEYCTITSDFASIDGKKFWELMYQAYQYVTAIPWTGPQAIRVYQTNDDMGSNQPFIKDVWQNRPEWFIEAMKTEAKLAQRVYAWHLIVPEQVRMLRDIGVRWIYIGADGKDGFTPYPSERHPLIQTLRNCRKYGLSTNLGFVLGLSGQTWENLNEWLEFRHWLVKNYSDAIAYINGWVHVVAPGSPDWDKLSAIDPGFKNSDLGDDPNFLEKVRATFFQKCTQLCAGGLGTDEVRSRLYDLSFEFEFERNELKGHHSYMLEP